MNPDAIEVHLFFLLQETTTVTPERLCWWDSGRAEQVLAKAGMHQHSPGQWSCTGRTASWFEETWSAIRGVPRAEPELQPDSVVISESFRGRWHRRHLGLIERTA